MLSAITKGCIKSHENSDEEGHPIFPGWVRGNKLEHHKRLVLNCNEKLQYEQDFVRQIKQKEHSRHRKQHKQRIKLRIIPMLTSLNFTL